MLFKKKLVPCSTLGQLAEITASDDASYDENVTLSWIKCANQYQCCTQAFRKVSLSQKLRLVFYPLTLYLVLFLPLPYRLSRCERDIFCVYTHSLLYIPVLVLVEDLLCFFREPVNFASKSFAHQFCMCYAFVSASSDHGVKFSFTTTQIEPRAQIEHIAFINSVSGWS